MDVKSQSRSPTPSLRRDRRWARSMCPCIYLMIKEVIVVSVSYLSVAQWESEKRHCGDLGLVTKQTVRFVVI